MAQCGLNVEPQNYNGHITSKVMGVTDAEKCCDSCAKFKGCIRWVLDIGAKECNLLSEDGVSLVGGSFMSGKVNPGSHPIAPCPGCPVCGPGDVGCNGMSPSCRCPTGSTCDPTAGTCSVPPPGGPTHPEGSEGLSNTVMLLGGLQMQILAEGGAATPTAPLLVNTGIVSGKCQAQAHAHGQPPSPPGVTTSPQILHSTEQMVRTTASDPVLPFCSPRDVGCNGKSPSCKCPTLSTCDPTAGTCSVMMGSMRFTCGGTSDVVWEIFSDESCATAMPWVALDATGQAGTVTSDFDGRISTGEWSSLETIAISAGVTATVQIKLISLDGCPAVSESAPIFFGTIASLFVGLAPCCQRKCTHLLCNSCISFCWSGCNSLLCVRSAWMVVIAVFAGLAIFLCGWFGGYQRAKRKQSLAVGPY